MTREDPVIFVLLVMPESKVRSLLMNAIADQPSDPGLPFQETPAFSEKGVTSSLTADLITLETLATMFKLNDKSTPVLILQKSDSEDDGNRFRELAEGEHPEDSANGAELVARVLAEDLSSLQNLATMLKLKRQSDSDHPDAPDREKLSHREAEILELLAQGASNQMLSQSLNITVNTVKTHLKNVKRKLNTANRKQMALMGKLIFYNSSEAPPESDGRETVG